MLWREKPQTDQCTKVMTSKYITYPQMEATRIAEGGLRLKKVFKGSLPDQPLVTIITVCWNSAATIEQTFHSVFRQTYSNIEYIVIDGGSTDGTLELIKKYEDKIDYYVAEGDRGLYHAMNKGVELASGDYLLILNSDDWYEDDCVERLWSALKHSRADFSCALASWIDRNGNFIRVLERMPYDESMRFGNSLRHELMFISKDIYNTIGNYDESFPIIADFDFSLRLLDAGYTLYEIGCPLLNFRVTGTSNTNWEKLDAEHYRLLKKQFPHLDEQIVATFANERAITAELINETLASGSGDEKFDQAMIAYGYRRDFFDSNRPPAVSKKISPRVSIAIPAYNAETFIVDTIRSIQNQSVKDIEVICVNDCSTDRTLALLQQLAAEDNRIHVFSNDVNRGETATRNRAMFRARGEYVFFVDADDQVAETGLARLLDFADRHRSDMVKGSLEKMTVSGHHICFSGAPPEGKAIINTTLKDSPFLLDSTEGFFTYLYRRSLLKNFAYPEGMVMGGDSLFLVTILTNALKISWINECVTKYAQHPNQAMKTYNKKKFLNDIEWRETVWHLLGAQGLHRIANRLAHQYWDPAVIGRMDEILAPHELKEVTASFAAMLNRTRFKRSTSITPDSVDSILTNISKSANLSREIPQIARRALQSPKEALAPIGVLNTFAAGGAGIAAERLADALRQHGHYAQSYNIFNASPSSNRMRLRTRPEIPGPNDLHAIQTYWHQIAVDPLIEHEQCKSRELFSLSFAISELAHMKELFSHFRLIHMHWVTGLFDYANVSAFVGNTPIIWTLHDMNPFTGGCHYSEGCEEYKNECRNCPLLREGSDVAHREWRIKKEALDKIPNLQVISPSPWLAKCAEESSLLGNRSVHYIPNVIPTDRFVPTNKVVARIKLGLPLDKKLLLFGAENVENRRKGGDLLQKTVDELVARGRHKGVEVILFGKSALQMSVKAHNMGHVSDEIDLALIYSAADAFVFPSREDNAPLSVGESLLCGTPVVAFPVGNVPEILAHGKTGYIAEYLNTGAMCRGIEWVLDANPVEGLKRSVRARAAALWYHDTEQLVAKVLDVYRLSLAK